MLTARRDFFLSVVLQGMAPAHPLSQQGDVMAFDPYDEKDFGRLRRSVFSSSKRWEDHLARRMDFMRQVAGFHFGAKGDACPDHVVFPLMGLMLKIFSRLIAANDPRAHVEHWDPDYDVQCHELKLSLDDEFERIDLGGGLNETTVESFFLAGFIKVGRVDIGNVEEISGYMNKTGGTFADRVLCEDMIFDMRSKRWQSIGYIGDWCRVPLEWVHENKKFPKKVREKVRAMNDFNPLPFGANMRMVRSQVLSAGRRHPLEGDYEDMTDIGTLFFPREQKILVTDRNVQHVLAWEDWDGPPHGPYHRLAYNHLPGNIVPLAPMAEVMDQHLLANTLGNKVGEMAKHQKRMLLATGKTGREDADAVMRGEDFDVVFVNDVKSVSPITLNGPDQGLWTLASLIKENFSYFSGNMDTAGGLAPMSGTVGQDKLLLESASRQVQDMQIEVTKLTRAVMNDIAWYIRHDPTWKRKLVKTIAGTSIRMPFTAQPAMLPGDFEDYRINLEPYNAQLRTPMERAAALKQDLKDWIIPLGQMLQGQGISLNGEYLVKTLSELQGSPELSGVFQYTHGEIERPAGDRGTKPAETKRTYERISRPQATQSGRLRVLEQAAAGVQSQPKEQAMLLR